MEDGSAQVKGTFSPKKGDVYDVATWKGAAIMPSEHAHRSETDPWGTLRWVPTDWDRSAAPASSYVGHWFSPTMGRGMWLRGRPALDLVGLFEAMAVLGLIQRYQAHPGRIEWGDTVHCQQCPVTFLLERVERPDCLVVATPRHCTRELPNPLVLDDADQTRLFDRIQVRAAQILPTVRKAMTPSRVARLGTDPTLQPLAETVRKIAHALLP